MPKGFELKLDPTDPHEDFSISGEKLSDDEREKIEKERKDYLLKRGARECGDELKFIDFDYYETVYRRIAEKSGLDPKKMNFLRPDKILLTDWPEWYGAYDPAGNLIVLNDIRAMAQAKALGHSYIEEMARMLFHEEIHATEKNVCIGQDVEFGPAKWQSGYVAAVGYTDLNPEYFWLNEGVTDLLSSEIFQEYVVAEGQSSPDVARNTQELYNTGCYKEAIALVKALIRKISNSAGIPKQDVWHALVRGSYSGEQFEDPELRKLFDETVGRGMLERIKNLGFKDKDGAARLAEEIEKSDGDGGRGK